jgi:hypothetical protein
MYGTEAGEEAGEHSTSLLMSLVEASRLCVNARRRARSLDRVSRYACDGCERVGVVIRRRPDGGGMCQDRGWSKSAVAAGQREWCLFV